MQEGGRPEVRQLARAGLVDEDVAGLHVAVHHALVVQVPQAPRDLAGVLLGARDGELAKVGQHLFHSGGRAEGAG